MDDSIRNASNRLKAAYALKTGAYITPEQARISARDVALMEAEGTGVTNATSIVPVIGTNGYDPCIAIIVYNRRAKKAAAGHYNQDFALHFEHLKVLATDPDIPDPTLLVHVVGVNKAKDHCANDFQLGEMESLLNAIANAPQTTLATFDVHDKPKPTGVAIDTRNGRLIRGSAVYRDHFAFHDAIRRGEDNLFESFQLEDPEFVFDGTRQDMQKPKSKTPPR